MHVLLTIIQRSYCINNEINSATNYQINRLPVISTTQGSIILFSKGLCINQFCITNTSVLIMLSMVHQDLGETNSMPTAQKSFNNPPHAKLRTYLITTMLHFRISRSMNQDSQNLQKQMHHQIGASLGKSRRVLFQRRLDPRCLQKNKKKLICPSFILQDKPSTKDDYIFQKCIRGDQCNG